MKIWLDKTKTQRIPRMKTSNTVFSDNKRKERSLRQDKRKLMKLNKK